MNLRIELFVENLEKSMEFYKTILEFNVPNEIQNTYIPIRKGNVVLGLSEMKNLPEHHPLKRTNPFQQKGIGVEIVLEVEDVWDTYKKVISKKYPIETELTKRTWGLEDFRIFDPDGYYIRITSRL